MHLRDHALQALVNNLEAMVRVFGRGFQPASDPDPVLVVGDVGQVPASSPSMSGEGEPRDEALGTAPTHGLGPADASASDIGTPAHAAAASPPEGGSRWRRPIAILGVLVLALFGVWVFGAAMRLGGQVSTILPLVSASPASTSAVDAADAGGRVALEEFLRHVELTTTRAGAIAAVHSSAQTPAEAAAWADDIEWMMREELAWLDSHPPNTCLRAAQGAWRREIEALEGAVSGLRAFAADPSQQAIEIMQRAQEQAAPLAAEATRQFELAVLACR
jgi:hypothetical protein